MRGRSPTSETPSTTTDLAFNLKLSTLVAGQLLERDGVLASMAARLRLALQNEARTLCYHFATQLGSTGRYGPEQGRAFEQNPLDNSVLAGTEQDTK